MPIATKTSPGGGTLVVVVPTAGGLVIAADSRITVGNVLVCDNSFKIAEIEAVDRAAIVATGFTTVWDTTPLNGLPMEGICDRFRELSPKFDALAVAKTKIEQRSDLATSRFDQLPGECLKDLATYIAQYPGVYNDFRGKKLFQIALGSYDVAENASYIRQFNVQIGADGAPHIDGIEVKKFLPDEVQSFQVLGEFGFMNSNVLHGPGLQFLTQRYQRFRELANDPIGKTDVYLASDFATDLIEATAKISQFIPAPTGVGGPVDVLLLGQEPRPKRLSWKILPVRSDASPGSAARLPTRYPSHGNQGESARGLAHLRD
ncbi:hypothetical protein ACVWWO_000987 [Bradyrhizobium sp. F1.13.1]